MLSKLTEHYSVFWCVFRGIWCKSNVNKEIVFLSNSNTTYSWICNSNFQLVFLLLQTAGLKQNYSVQFADLRQNHCLTVRILKADSKSGGLI